MKPKKSDSTGEGPSPASSPAPASTSAPPSTLPAVMPGEGDGGRFRPTASIRAVLVRLSDEARVVLTDEKGRECRADYRRHAGLLRELIREFTTEKLRQEAEFSWGEEEPNGAPTSGTPFGTEHSRISGFESMGIRPSARFLDLALGAGILENEEGDRLTSVEGLCRLEFRVRPSTAERLAVILRPIEEGSGEEVEATSGVMGQAYVDAIPETAIARALSPRHLLLGDLVYGVEDLGPDWMGLQALSAFVPARDLVLHLSTCLSRLPDSVPSRQGWRTEKGGLRIARPAILFREIDSYGYLHVYPFNWVEGFPPGFIEEGDISRVVEMDAETKTMRVFELVFPRIADEEFRLLLASSGKAAKTAVFEEAGRFVFEPDFVESFLSENMGRLIAGFALFEADKLRRYKILPARPRLKLRISSGIDFLGGRADVEIAGEKFEYAKFLAAYRREGSIMLSDGSRAFPDKREIERFERLLRKAKGSQDLFEISAFDLPALERQAEVEGEGEHWERMSAFYGGFNSIGDLPDPPEPKGASLRPYQIFGTKWIAWLAKHDLNGCLADEMGLGKTLQAISVLRSLGKKAWVALVVMPKSLLFNWASELARFAPEFRVLVYHGPDRDPGKLAGKGRSIVLTSYATLRNDLEEFEKLKFEWLILDESQTIKNSETLAHRAVSAIKARHRLALSGTPVENHLGELWSLFEFLNPGFFGSQGDFLKRWQHPIQEGGDENALRDLRVRIYPFILRRRKADVLADLPEKTEQTALVELEPAHLAAYHKRRLELKARVDAAIEREGVAKSSFLVLAAMTELRRFASLPETEGAVEGQSAKRAFLRELVPELVEAGHKALVFTNYLAAVDLVSEDLAGQGIGNLVMTGATSDRATIVERFQTDPGVSVLTMTLKTGGLGLNLTAADYVFIFDPWWNRAAEAQAIDRTHRIGQKNPVFCYRLIAKETIEERMYELQERKASLVGSLLAADAEVAKTLDAGDIAYLLG